MTKRPQRLPGGFTLDRERLAWAAGFYDGEGSSFRRLGRNPRLVVNQATDDAALVPEVLTRFREVVGLGTIRLKRGPRPAGHRPQYEWTAQNFEACQAVIALLWPWLGTVKREQASRTLRAAPMPLNRYGAGFCSNGHPNPQRDKRGVCWECRREQHRRQYRKRKADHSSPWWQRTHCFRGHELAKVGRLLGGQCAQCKRDEARRYRATHPDRHRRSPGRPPAQGGSGDA